MPEKGFFGVSCSMTGSQKKQFRKRFCQHIYPVKTFRGDPTRPAYTLYSLWDYPTHLAADNELDELLDQWPHNRSRTLALLAVHAAFYENGAPHWAEQTVWDENQTNVHALMLYERQRERNYDPIRAARHAENRLLAQAALVESQRRKQGSSTGKPQPRARGIHPKRLHGLKKCLPRKAAASTLNAQLDRLILAAATTRH